MRKWELVGPVLPPERGRRARPAGDNRRFLSGMLHVLRVGCPGGICTKILLGHTNIENTVRHLGLDVDDALTLSERREI